MSEQRNFLGLVATHERKIRDGQEFDKFFPRAEGKGKIVVPDGNVRQTVRLMGDIVLQYASDTKQIAELLRGDSLNETCRNVWAWCYNHIQYKLDKDGVEQLRRPARTWADRKSGVDCDCFSIFVGSILHNLGIPYRFRVTKYEAGWQHVYVIVPDGKGHITLDCVLDGFNDEKPFTDNFDHKMEKHYLSGIPIEFLSGISGETDNQLNEVLTGGCLCGIAEEPTSEQRLAKLKQYLITTRDYIEQNPSSVLLTGGAKNNLKMLNYAIEYWDTPKRDEALSILVEAENKLSEGKDEAVNGLGKISVKKFFGNVKEAVSNVVDKVGAGLHNAAQAVVKYNPVSLAIRGAYLLSLKINLFHMSQHLYPAYMTEAEAARSGVSSADWNASKRALAKVESMFVDKLKGSKENLKEAITEGRASKKYEAIEREAGVSGIGSVLATVGTMATAAAPILSTAKDLDEAGVLPKDKKKFAEKAGGFFKKVGTGVRNLFNKDKGAQDDSASRESAPAPDEGAAPPPSAPPSDEPKPGFFQKVGTFVKENPGKTAAIAVVAAAGITLAVSPKARKAVGLGGTSVKVYRKGKRVRPRKGYLPRGSKVKSINLRGK